MLNNCFKLNKLNILVKTKNDNIAIAPPIKPEKNGVKKCNNIFATKLPSKLVGNEIIKTLKMKFVNLKLKFGNVFLIFIRFKIDIVDIESEKEIIIELIPTNGVNIIKLINKIIEPMM